MTPYRTLFAVILLLLLQHRSAAQFYFVTSNSTWTGTVIPPSNCNNCFFLISAGVTFTLDQNATCSSCFFAGGNMTTTTNFTCQSCVFVNDSITLNNTLSLQDNGSGANSFLTTVLTANGTSQINATSAISLTTSTFTFKNTSFFYNNGGQFDASQSVLTFLNNAYFLANAGPVNLTNTSALVAGNGGLASAAHIDMQIGTGLNIDGTSRISIMNHNNYYFNWSTYKSTQNNKTYTTTNNMLNCNGTFPHACNSPNAAYLYGCATLTKAGPVACIPLAITQPALSAIANNATVRLSWSATQELHAEHFVIQRSPNGLDWSLVSTIAAQSPNSGNTDYTFTDLSPLDGSNYYRLLIPDMDGQIIYSQIARVSVNTFTDGISLFPNPVTQGTFHLKAPAGNDLVVKVFSSMGQLLFLSSLKGQPLYEVKMPSSIPRNCYLIVQVISSGKTQSFSVLNQ